MRTLARLLAVALFVVGLTACEINKFHGPSYSGNAPTNLTTSVESVLLCEAEALDSLPAGSDDGVLLYVVDFGDGTTRVNVNLPGQLTEGAGRTAVGAIVSTFGNRHVLTVARPNVDILEAYANGRGVGRALVDELKRLYRVRRIVILDGAFVALGPPMGESGNSAAGSLIDNVIRFTMGAARREDSRTVILSAQLTEVGELPIPIGSVELTQTVTTSSVSVRMELGYDKVGFDFGRQRVVAENVHAAQLTVARAAVAGAVAILFGDSVRDCLQNPRSSPAVFAERMRRFRDMLEHDRIKAAQRALHAAGFYAGPINGLLGPATRSAAAAFYRRSGQWPDNLDTTTGLTNLYAKLLVVRSA